MTEDVRHTCQVFLQLWGIKVMNPEAAAVMSHIPLTNVQSLTSITLLTSAKHTVTIVVIMAYLVMEEDKKKRKLHVAQANKSASFV